MKPDKRITERGTTDGKAELYKGVMRTRWYWNCAIGSGPVVYCEIGDTTTFSQALADLNHHLKEKHSG